MKFFMPMVPPTVTAQEHKVSSVNGKIRLYDPPEVKAARAKLISSLAKFRPEKHLDGPIYLKVQWLFPTKNKQKPGDFKITKPDTDNLQKMLKDCMTYCGFWKDDAQVCVEHVEKRFNDISGIFIEIEELK